MRLASSRLRNGRTLISLRTVINDSSRRRIRTVYPCRLGVGKTSNPRTSRHGKLSWPATLISFTPLESVSMRDFLARHIRINNAIVPGMTTHR